MTEPDPRKRFAVNLKKARKKVGISQEELGLRCDLHRTEISLLERSRREPRLGTVVRLASVLDVSIESLFDGIAWDIEGKKFRLKK